MCGHGRKEKGPHLCHCSLKSWCFYIEKEKTPPPAAAVFFWKIEHFQCICILSGRGGVLFIRKCVRTNSLCVAWPGAEWSSVWKGIVQCFFVRSRRNKIGTRDWRQFWITWLPFFHKSGYFFSFLKLPPPLLFPFFSCFLLEAWQVCLCFGFGKSSSSGLVVINSPFIFPFGLWALWW